jgi:hypothetical protein
MMETVPGPSFYQHNDPRKVLERGGSREQVDAAWRRINASEFLEGFVKVSTISITLIQFIFMGDNLKTSRSEIFMNRGLKQG